MTERENALEAFLARSGWDRAAREMLAGDASNRRYLRLKLDGEPAVLMDAPPSRGEDVRPFIKIADHLASVGLSPPRIFARDETQGFLLLEDLGDALFSTVVARDSTEELPLYRAATDTLIALHAQATPDAPDYGAETMAELAGLAGEWYAFGASGRRDDDAAKALKDAMRGALFALTDWSPVLVLRDYHAENLLWLPDRSGAARVGLLDFQDAGLGHPAYDLMSLARDARRDVSPATRDAMIAHYIAGTGQNEDAFRLACATVSAQRNLRILGVFARLSLHFGKAHYVDLIPRVWRNLQDDLAHPGLDPLAEVVARTLPEPSDATLATLKEKCGTIPKL